MLRLLAQGLIELTAELRYDCSTFFSGCPGAMVEADACGHAARRTVPARPRDGRSEGNGETNERVRERDHANLIRFSPLESASQRES